MGDFGEMGERERNEVVQLTLKYFIMRRLGYETRSSQEGYSKTALMTGKPSPWKQNICLH